MIKEYLFNFSSMSIIVMVLFFVLFGYLAVQAMRLGSKKAEEFSQIPIQAELETQEKINNAGVTNG